MYNKLIDRHTRSTFFSNNGSIPTETEYRRTGKSTARALEIISSAMQSPGTHVPIYEVGYNATHDMRCNLRFMIQCLISKLELKEFLIKKYYSHNTKEKYEEVLIYDIFTANPWEIK